MRALAPPPATANSTRTLKRVDTAAALGSGSAPLPSLPQPRPRAAHLILGSGPSRFEATRQPFKGPPEAADLRPNLPQSPCRYVGPMSAEGVRRRAEFAEAVFAGGALDAQALGTVVLHRVPVRMMDVLHARLGARDLTRVVV